MAATPKFLGFTFQLISAEELRKQIDANRMMELDNAMSGMNFGTHLAGPLPLQGSAIAKGPDLSCVDMDCSDDDAVFQPKEQVKTKKSK